MLCKNMTINHLQSVKNRQNWAKILPDPDRASVQEGIRNTSVYDHGCSKVASFPFEAFLINCNGSQTLH